MERSPENTSETNFEKLVEAASAWGERRAAEILAEGEPLCEEEMALAREVGVRAPEQVRVLEVDCIPPLEDENLTAVSNEAGLHFDRSQGLTLGYGIYIVKGARSRQLMSHELRHIQQYEEAGSVRAFLATYITELQTYGYQDAPLELDAKCHEQI